MTDTNDEFDHLVFIGRFQPFHHGHEFVVKKALSKARQVIMLIGSANSPRTIKNPFTFEERTQMILSAFDDTDRKRIHCLPIDDTLYNDHKWLQNIQTAIVHTTEANARIGIIGHNKDDSSYYLSLFPNWGAIELPSFENLSATPLRKLYFADGIIDKRMPDASWQFLQAFKHTTSYVKLYDEYHHIQAFKKQWQNTPYPPIFTTADALIVQSGHILLVERGGEYGNGLWALPGGFLDINERLIDCVLRELSEETGLSINHNTLKSRHTFDAPDRSLRGRTITTVFHFELTGNDLPTVKAGDDAKGVFWLPIHALDGKKMFEDHYSIITNILGI
ncbi:bifunctional nicotinamide-nucleotide adenylyltransferase/Nudix hydroxylase [Moraxella haemolytica]|uniref:bifunctional nicotinamide-nucleotide adenylyltransferase/Nudix hydroxylase n=1 Tax=Moraxella haemolytica TaxID=2904119 RepID=UPI002542B670|nr:bifunctional nicotinamide-nucleotide adenylyltransferase/Nudix hydroxylase [Moraxella sp. ZY171148]WII95408.1 bifunctional nicotinamide-nucleotide adenylyltransferase/Nudix hydroxylase [Moraxella sp. ZY171148]